MLVPISRSKSYLTCSRLGMINCINHIEVIVSNILKLFRSWVFDEQQLTIKILSVTRSLSLISLTLNVGKEFLYLRYTVKSPSLA